MVLPNLQLWFEFLAQLGEKGCLRIKNRVRFGSEISRPQRMGAVDVSRSIRAKMPDTNRLLRYNFFIYVQTHPDTFFYLFVTENYWSLIWHCGLYNETGTCWGSVSESANGLYEIQRYRHTYWRVSCNLFRASMLPEGLLSLTLALW